MYYSTYNWFGWLPYTLTNQWRNLIDDDKRGRRWCACVWYLNIMLLPLHALLCIYNLFIVFNTCPSCTHNTGEVNTQLTDGWARPRPIHTRGLCVLLVGVACARRGTLSQSQYQAAARRATMVHWTTPPQRAQTLKQTDTQISADKGSVQRCIHILLFCR